RLHLACVPLDLHSRCRRRPASIASRGRSLRQAAVAPAPSPSGVAFVSMSCYFFWRGDAPLSLAPDHERTSTGGVPEARKTRVVILGGGFGGGYTARHLEKLCKRRPDVRIILVSRANFLLVPPLLFEVCSGTLDLRHCAFPVRAFLRTTRFGEAVVQGIDLERRTVRVASAGQTRELAYDQLVVALGALTNQGMI